MVWKPVSLELLRTLTEGPIALADMAPQKEQIVMQDLGRRLRHANLPFVPAYHPGHLLHPSATDAALRVLAAAGEDRVPDVARALFAAAHERQVDLSDPEAVALAVASGVAGDIQVDLVAVAGDADGPAAAAVAANTEELSLLGGFTTPSVVVGDQLFSGEDRLHFAHHALGDTDAKPARRLASPPLDDHGSRRKLSFFFDFGSPWSYLGAMQASAWRCCDVWIFFCFPFAPPAEHRGGGACGSRQSHLEVFLMVASDGVCVFRWRRWRVTATPIWSWCRWSWAPSLPTLAPPWVM